MTKQLRLQHLPFAQTAQRRANALAAHAPHSPGRRLRLFEMKRHGNGKYKSQLEIYANPNLARRFLFFIRVNPRNLRLK